MRHFYSLCSAVSYMKLFNHMCKSDCFGTNLIYEICEIFEIGIIELTKSIKPQMKISEGNGLRFDFRISVFCVANWRVLLSFLSFSFV